MRQVELFKIIIDEKSADQIIVLKEKDGGRHFPIVIGMVEASSIKMKIADVSLPRPLTHDLLISTIAGLGARLDRVLIDELVDSTFYAKLIIIDKEGHEQRIDSRPSDSIALAVRASVPIFVDEKVMEKASVLQ